MKALDIIRELTYGMSPFNEMITTETRYELTCPKAFFDKFWNEFFEHMTITGDDGTMEHPKEKATAQIPGLGFIHISISPEHTFELKKVSPSSVSA